MIALSTDARRLVIRTSGNLERQLKLIAKQVAQDAGALEVSSDHIVVAIRKLADDNAALLQLLLGDEGVVYGERKAG